MVSIQALQQHVSQELATAIAQNIVTLQPAPDRLTLRVRSETHVQGVRIGSGMILGERTVDYLKTWVSAMMLPGLDQQGEASWRFLSAAYVLWRTYP